MRTRLLFLALLLSAAAPLAAQFDTTNVVGRVLSRRVARLDRDTVLNAVDVDQALNEMNFTRMSDSLLQSFAVMMGSVMGRVSLAECSTVMSGPDSLFWKLLEAVADSSEAEGWANMLEEIIWLEVDQSPPGIVAPVETAQAVMVALIRHASPKDLGLLQKAQANPENGTCILVPWLFSRLAAKSPARMGPVIRYLFISGQGAGQ